MERINVLRGGDVAKDFFEFFAFGESLRVDEFQQTPQLADVILQRRAG